MTSAFFVHRAENKTIVGGGYSLTTLNKENLEQMGGGDPVESHDHWAVPSGLAVLGGGGDKDSFDYEIEKDVSEVAPDSYFGGGSDDQKPSFTESRKKRSRKKSTTGTKRIRKKKQI